MAAIRHCLQKELFEANAERLLVFCEVAKLLKRKKTCYLCLVSNTEVPSALTIYQVKKLDKNTFKKKRSWLISEIKSVDGGNEPNTLILDITADKLYRWIALNEHDRQQFVIALSQLTVHNKEKIQFIHFPETWTASQNIQSPDSPLILPPQLVESENVIDYNALTDIEESELATLIGGCDTAIENAEQFMQQLCDKLFTLDGENIESMLASEAQVEALMSKLDDAISHAEVIEGRLERYDDMLRHIRDTMDKMEEKNGMIETANRNSQKLLQQLESIVSWLDVTGVSMDIVLTTPEGRDAALRAGNVLRNALLSPQPPFIQRLSAVQEQIRKVNKYKDKFTQSVTRHLNNLLIHLSNDASQEALPEGLALPMRSSIHAELRDYAPLMHWMKQMDQKAYSGLTKVYINSLSKLYDRDVKQFFENARQMVTSAVVAGNTKEKKSKHADDQSSNSSASHQFDSVMEQVLSQLEPVCLSEQDFFVYFFQLDISLSKSAQQSMEGSFTADSSGTITASQSTDDLLNTPIKDLSPGSSVGGGDQENKKAKDKAASELRKLMSELFPCLESELGSFIAHYEKLDSYGSMRAVARLGSHVLSDTEMLPMQPSFPSWVFGACLVRAKRSADKAIGDKLKAMAEAGRITVRRNKCGVLPYVNEFEEFCMMAESIFGKSGRRADVDKWYVQIVSSMMMSIQHHEHPKTPQQVIRMENFHHLHDLLSQLKLPALDGLRKDAKMKYNEALKTYVTTYFGRPLEKLNQFFEGVQDRVNQGVKEEEISYQMAFSKQELRKVIALYPHKEVKKGLDSLYRKVEKHLCEEENLLQVVWRAMQEEFITQYKYLEERIQNCYPGSMIALDFSIQDILESFSEIARSH